MMKVLLLIISRNECNSDCGVLNARKRCDGGRLEGLHVQRIVPEWRYLNEPHDIVSVGVIRPCEPSKQLSVNSNSLPYLSTLADDWLYEHFTLDVDVSVSFFHRRHLSSALLDCKCNKQSL